VVLTRSAPRWTALAAALAVLVVGVRWGTKAAGGSDSSCYLNQARLFTHFTTHIEQPLVTRAFWPRAEWTFAPAGHIPSPVRRDFLVPMCPPGLPLVMTAAHVVRAELLVVPLCGALVVWLTFVLGRRIDAPSTGAAAAVLVACSPILLYQIVQPMTDVPAAAWWLLAVVLATGSSASSGLPLATGLVAGLAVMTRPNLIPLAFVIAIFIGVTARSIGAVLRFAAGLVPGLTILALIQTAMYGSPIATGYGEPRDLFQMGRLGINLRHYASWFVGVHTPAILLAFAAPLVAQERRIIWLGLAIAATTLASYLPYQVFDDWSYIRFLLPALPFVVVFTVLVISRTARRLVPRQVGVLLALATSALAITWLARARDRGVFNLVDLERHFIDAGHYAAEQLPRETAVLTVLESGAVHYYSQRPTVSWDTLPPDSLDRTLEFLRREGLPPVLMIDASEEQTFRTRFGSASAIGRLDWPPGGHAGRTVRVYDPADRARYFAR